MLVICGVIPTFPRVLISYTVKFPCISTWYNYKRTEGPCMNQIVRSFLGVCLTSLSREITVFQSLATSPTECSQCTRNIDCLGNTFLCVSVPEVNVQSDNSVSWKMLTQATGATPVHILGNVKETYFSRKLSSRSTAAFPHRVWLRQLTTCY